MSMSTITHKAEHAGKPSTTLFFHGYDNVGVDGHLSAEDMVTILNHDVLVIEGNDTDFTFTIRTSHITYMHHTN